MTAMPENHADLAAYAKQRFDSTNEALRKLATANQTLLEADSQTYSCSGQLSIAGAVIYTSVAIADMSFDSGATKIHFNGSGWGIGFGAGTSYGNGWFNVPPSTLVSYDSVSFQVSFVAGGAGATQIAFFGSNGQYLGEFVAAMLGIGAGSFGGSGEFKSGS